LVLEYLRENKLPIPFILMTGSHQAELNLKELAHGLGFFRIFEKPFNLDELITALEESMNSKGNSCLEEFCRIRIESLLLEESISWPIYLKLSDKKFVKISREGDQTLNDVISHYRQKDISSFYMKREDFKQWVDSLFALNFD